jgi:hypothetical protein
VTQEDYESEREEHVPKEHRRSNMRQVKKWSKKVVINAKALFLDILRLDLKKIYKKTVNLIHRYLLK